MFSIDTKRINIKNSKTGEITSFNPGNDKYKPDNEFDLPNNNVYDLKGNIVYEAINPDSYNLRFAVELKRTPILKCTELLNHHFDRTPDKEKFLLHIRYNTLIFPFIKDEQKEKFDFVITWIEEKNKQLQLYKDFIPIQTDFLFDRVPFEIAMSYSFPVPDIENFRYRYIRVQRNNFFFYSEYISWSNFTEHLEAGKLFDEELNKLSFENLDPYFNIYADGFIKGYTEFDNRINNTTKIFKNDTPAINKIYEYAISSIGGLTCYNSKVKNKKIYDIVTKDLWYEAGIKEGEKYRAWVLIIDSPFQYLDLFRNAPYFETYCRRAYKFWENKQGGEGWKERLSKILLDFDKTKPEQTATHREMMLAYNYKIKVGKAEFKSSTDWFNEGGQGRKEAFYNTDPNSKNPGKNKYIKPKIKELKKVVELLNDCPEAKFLAINDLDQLQSL